MANQVNYEYTEYKQYTYHYNPAELYYSKNRKKTLLKFMSHLHTKMWKQATEGWELSSLFVPCYQWDKTISEVKLTVKFYSL